MKRISGLMHRTISCIVVGAVSVQMLSMPREVAAASTVAQLASNMQSAQVVHYYYHNSEISAANDDNNNNSFVFANHERLAALTVANHANGAQQLTDVGTVSSYYLGDNKNQDMLVSRASLGDGLLMDSQQQATDYQAYGQHDQQVADAATSFGYNGEYQDPVTGLTYLRARDYQAGSQRFVSMDSYHVWNKYNFADADPIGNIDPSGHLSMPKISKGSMFGLAFLAFNLVNQFVLSKSDKPTESAIISGIFTAVTFAGLFFTVPELAAAVSGEAAAADAGAGMAAEAVGAEVGAAAGKVSASRVISAGLSVVADAGAMVSSGSSLYAQTSYILGSSSPETIAKAGKVAEISQWVSMGALGGMALKGIGGWAVRGGRKQLMVVSLVGGVVVILVKLALEIWI